MTTFEIFLSDTQGMTRSEVNKYCQRKVESGEMDGYMYSAYMEKKDETSPTPEEGRAE